ncbi:type II 3-dehydroquinate dehydratase [Nocardioides sp. Bht2]|uniref:type II 3-dehydroquinate dehydratase n=1 Tax=Nocardioides sp. Bht2 TaxID=3392297 RepID=UPI0039B61472
MSDCSAGYDPTRWSSIRTGEKRYRIGVIDGPNMSNMHRRDRSIYGGASIQDLQGFVHSFGESIGVETVHLVSNHEGDIIEWIHENAPDLDGFLINPAGLTFTGEPTKWALSDSNKPYIEVHFRNVVAGKAMAPLGEERRFVFTTAAKGEVMGFAQYSYTSALLALIWVLDDPDLSGELSLGQIC